MINEFISAAHQLEDKLELEPTIEEMADEMNISEEMAGDIMGFVRKPVSLESLAGSEDLNRESLTADTDEDVFEYVSMLQLKDQLQEVLNTLSPREKMVLEMRFGIGDDKMHTLREVGNELNLSPERIRQIEAKALRRLRHPRDFKKEEKTQ